MFQSVVVRHVGVVVFFVEPFAGAFLFRRHEIISFRLRRSLPESSGRWEEVWMDRGGNTHDAVEFVVDA